MGEMFRWGDQESARNGEVSRTSKRFRDTANLHFVSLAPPGRLGQVHQEHGLALDEGRTEQLCLGFEGRYSSRVNPKAPSARA